MDQVKAQKKSELLTEATTQNQEKLYLSPPRCRTIRKPEKLLSTKFWAIMGSIPLPPKIKKFFYGEF